MVNYLKYLNKAARADAKFVGIAAFALSTAAIAMCVEYLK